MSRITSFQVSTNRSGRRRTVKVKVYDDIEVLRRATFAHNGTPDAEQDEHDFVGVCQPLSREAYSEKKGWTVYPDAGYIRLWKDRLAADVIAHEATHMAVAIYQDDILSGQGHIYDIETLEKIKENEEILCLLVGDLTAKINNKLSDKGFYK